jgi:hypothetical protein
MGALIIAPKPEHQGQSRTPAARAKVYESSVRQEDGSPLLTLALFGDHVPFGVQGLRLDRRQVQRLTMALEDWLLGEGVEDERA